MEAPHYPRDSTGILSRKIVPILNHKSNSFDNSPTNSWAMYTSFTSLRTTKLLLILSGPLIESTVLIFSHLGRGRSVEHKNVSFQFLGKPPLSLNLVKGLSSDGKKESPQITISAVEEKMSF